MSHLAQVTPLPGSSSEAILLHVTVRRGCCWRRALSYTELALLMLISTLRYAVLDTSSSSHQNKEDVRRDRHWKRCRVNQNFTCSVIMNCFIFLFENTRYCSSRKMRFQLSIWPCNRQIEQMAVFTRQVATCNLLQTCSQLLSVGIFGREEEEGCDGVHHASWCPTDLPHNCQYFGKTPKLMPQSPAFNQELQYWFANQHCSVLFYSWNMSMSKGEQNVVAVARRYVAVQRDFARVVSHLCKMLCALLSGQTQTSSTAKTCSNGNPVHEKIPHRKVSLHCSFHWFKKCQYVAITGFQLNCRKSPS